MTDQPKPLEDREKIVAAWDQAITAHDCHSSIRVAGYALAALIEADGKRLAEADELMLSVMPLPFQTWRDQRDEWRLRCKAAISSSRAPETDALRDALGLAEKALAQLAGADGTLANVINAHVLAGRVRSIASKALAAIAALHTPSPKEAETHDGKGPRTTKGPIDVREYVARLNDPSPTPAPATGETRPFGWACQRRTLAGPEPGPNTWTDFKEGSERPRDTRKWFPLYTQPPVLPAADAEGWQKPHKGTISDWRFGPSWGDDDTVLVHGTAVDHPEFAGEPIHTSYVVKIEIETRNSRYTLTVPSRASLAAVRPKDAGARP